MVRKYRTIYYFFILVIPRELIAENCKAIFTPFNKIKITQNEILIVTHASEIWDTKRSSKKGIDKTIEYAKSNNLEIVYLASDEHRNGDSYVKDCNPTYWAKSSGGELHFPINSNHIISVGGKFEFCQGTTIAAIIFDNWGAKNKEDLVITQVLDSIYMVGSDIREDAPYYTKYKNAVTEYIPHKSIYKGGDIVENPITLLQLRDIIKDQTQYISFLKNHLPFYQNISTNYQIIFNYNNLVIEVIRKGIGFNPPTLTFEFIDSI